MSIARLILNVGRNGHDWSASRSSRSIPKEKNEGIKNRVRVGSGTNWLRARSHCKKTSWTQHCVRHFWK